MKKRILIVLLFLLLLSGCRWEEFTAIHGYIRYVERENNPLDVKVSVDAEQWEINQYNGRNLYYLNGNIYYISDYNMYQINGLTSNIHMQLDYYGTFYYYNSNIYQDILTRRQGVDGNILNHIDLSTWRKFNSKKKVFDDIEAPNLYYSIFPIHGYSYVVKNEVSEIKISEYNNLDYYLKNANGEIQLVEKSKSNNSCKYIKTIGQNVMFVNVVNTDDYVVVLETEYKFPKHYLEIVEYDELVDKYVYYEEETGNKYYYDDVFYYYDSALNQYVKNDEKLFDGFIYCDYDTQTIYRYNKEKNIWAYYLDEIESYVYQDIEKQEWMYFDFVEQEYKKFSDKYGEFTYDYNLVGIIHGASGLNRKSEVKVSVYDKNTNCFNFFESTFLYMGCNDYKWINYFDSNLYMIIYKNNKLIAYIFNIESGDIYTEEYDYSFEKDIYSYLLEPFAYYIYDINIFDNRYYYIVEDRKVVRIDRTTGLVELVFEVVE